MRGLRLHRVNIPISILYALILTILQYSRSLVGKVFLSALPPSKEKDAAPDYHDYLLAVQGSPSLGILATKALVDGRRVT